MDYLARKVSTELIIHTVARFLTCPITGVVLDWRTTVVVEFLRPDESLVARMPFDGAYWDHGLDPKIPFKHSTGEHFVHSMATNLGYSVVIHDGRAL